MSSYDEEVNVFVEVIRIWDLGVMFGLIIFFRSEVIEVIVEIRRSDKIGF